MSKGKLTCLLFYVDMSILIGQAESFAYVIGPSDIM